MNEEDDEYEEVLPTIAQLLPAFFGARAEDSTGIKLRRLEQVFEDLQAYLETSIDQYLTTGEATVLAAEREFNPKGAASRVLDVTVLLEALPGFIQAPHLAQDLLLRSTQLDLVSGLCYFIVYRVLRDCDASCLLITLERALALANRDLQIARREQSQARRLARLPPHVRASIERALQHVDAQLPAMNARRPS